MSDGDIPFRKQMNFEYGVADQVTPLVRLFVWRLSIPLLIILAAVACQAAAAAFARRDTYACIFHAGAFASSGTGPLKIRRCGDPISAVVSTSASRRS